MTPTLVIFLRWWIGELIDALVRPVFCREGGAGIRFCKLVNACDCYPYAVGWDMQQLWISDRPTDVDEWRDEYGREEP